MKMNKHYNELKASYLFVDIAHKVAAYQEAHPEKEIIRLGIGDVTQPLAKCVVDAMHDAVTEMGTKEGFHGYGPEQGYPFLKQAIQGYYAGRGTGHILPRLERGSYRRVLFIATGALMSQTTFLQKESIPAIAHLVELRGPECTARG